MTKEIIAAEEQLQKSFEAAEQDGVSLLDQIKALNKLYVIHDADGAKPKSVASTITCMSFMVRQVFVTPEQREQQAQAEQNAEKERLKEELYEKHMAAESKKKK